MKQQKSKFLAVITSALCATLFLSSVLYAQGTVTLDITAFGAIPNSGEDACPAVKAALAKAREIGKPVTIRFPKGRYDFFKASAIKVHHPVTAVHRQWDHVTPFYLKELKDVTIDGGGSLFMMHGRMTPMVLYRCKDIKLINIAVDQEYPTVQEAKVVAVGKNTIDLRVHPDTRYVMGDDGKPVWLDADGKISEQPNVWNTFYPDTNSTARGGGRPFQEATKVEELEPSLLRCYVPQARKYRIGSSLQWRWHIRNQQGMIILESRDVSLESFKLHTTNGLGILAQLSHNLSFDHLQVEPREETGRTAASFADCIQISLCTGTILVEGCRFNRAHDDAINIYGFMVPVKKVISPRTLLLNLPCWEQCGFNVFFPGDKIGFRHRSDLLLKESNTIVSSELVDKVTIKISLKDDVPPGVQDLIAENLSRMPDKVIIRNNYIGGMSTRGILMNTSRDTLIEGNTFDRIRRSAIEAKTPDGHYWLQNHIDGLVIRNNTFFECHGWASQNYTPGYGIINIDLQTKTAVHGEYPHKDIYVVGNHFINKQAKPTAVKARGVKGIYIKGNTFENKHASPNLVNVFGCADIELSGNKMKGTSGRAKITYGQMDPSEIKAAPDTQWVLRDATKHN